MFVESTTAHHWLLTEESLFDIKKNNVFPQCDHEQAITEKVNKHTLLVRYYEHKLQELALKIGIPEKIQATALCFLKRFYLYHSLRDYQPKNIMLTCLYIGSKVEEHHVNLHELSQRLRVNPDVILSLEMLVLEALKFHLTLYHPHRPLRGFVEDFFEYLKKENMLDSISTTRDSWVQAGIDFINNRILLSDTPLLFPPAQLALVALTQTIEEISVQLSQLFRQYIEDRFSAKAHFPTLVKNQKKIVSILKQTEKPPTREVATQFAQEFKKPKKGKSR